MLLHKNYTTLVDAYAQYLNTLGFASTTIYNYPIFIKNFLYYLQQQQNIQHIQYLTSNIIQQYFTHLENSTGKWKGKPLSSSHLNTNFIAIDKFLEFLHHAGMTNAPTPLLYKIEHHAQKQIVVLTTQHIQTLYNTIPLLFNNYTMAQREPRQMCVRLVLDLCYGCGLRRFEALNLKINDIDFNTKTIHLKQGKNYKDRLIPMSEGIYKSLQNFVYNYRKHFANKRPHYIYPFKNYTIANALIFLLEHCNDTELQQLKPSLHSLRHSIATHLLQKGMSIENIARFLGHSTLESTAIYTHFI
jgi:integrase/recombinase XerD